MKLTSINNGVALQIDEFDITCASKNDINKVLEHLKKNLIVVIKKQDKSPAFFTNFVSNLGPISNYTQFRWDPKTGKEIYNPDPNSKMIDPLLWDDPTTYPVQRVTGKKIDGKKSGIFGSGILDWHANLNGLDRADGVALQGYQDCENTSTTWLNLAKAYEEMPTDLKNRCENVFCEYEYSPEIWASGLPETQKQAMLSNRGDGRITRGNTGIYRMWLVQENIAGTKGIYFYTNNKCKIISKDQKLYEDLKNFIFQKKYMYTHEYELGDIVLSDQLLSLHKRDQNDPEILEKRILHRLTFRISNFGNPSWISLQNKINID